MPTVFRTGRYRFFFYSNEGSPREPPHVHAEAGDEQAKLWLRPQVRLAYNDGFDSRALKELLQLVEANRERIETAWRRFFGQAGGRPL